MAEGISGGDGLPTPAPAESRKEQQLSTVPRLRAGFGNFFRPRTTPAEIQFAPPTTEKEPVEPAELWYHYTTPENAQSIRATGLRGSNVGSFGPGVYISNKPIPQHSGRFEIIMPQLQGNTRLLEINWEGSNNPHKIITALYGEAGKKLYKASVLLVGNDGWVYLQKLAKDKGYDGFSYTSHDEHDPLRDIKQAVIFDPKKLSLAESPATRTVA